MEQQKEPVYRPPSHEALRALGFVPFQVVPNFQPHARAGCSGGTGGIWVYEGYKGSQPLEIIFLSHGWFTLGPKDTKGDKVRARDGYEFQDLLYKAGYPNKTRKKELDIEDEAKQLEQWEAAVLFAQQWHKPLPPRPRLKYFPPAPKQFTLPDGYPIPNPETH